MGDPSSVPGLGRSPGEGNGNPLQFSYLENSMDKGAWQAYSPWGHKESHTTEQLTLSHTLTIIYCIYHAAAFWRDSAMIKKKISWMIPDNFNTVLLLAVWDSIVKNRLQR